jgi:hypothetical protein
MKRNQILLLFALFLAGSFYPLAVTFGQNSKKIAAMATDLEISAIRIKQAVGLPLEKLTAFETAELNFYKTPENSPEREAALLQWIVVSTNVEQIKQVFNFTNTRSENEREAFKKWVYLSKNFGEIEEAFTSIGSITLVDHPQDAALLRWLTSATNSQEVEKVYNYTPANSGVKQEAFLKWLGLVELSECWHFYERVYNYEEFRSLALKRWSELFLLAISRADSYEEVEDLMYFCDVVRDAANSSGDDLVEYDYGYIKGLPLNCRPPSDEFIQPALQKYVRLAKEKINQAERVEEVGQIYYYGPDSQSVKEQALLKWIELSQTLDEVVEAINNCELGSEAETTAIKKAYELWPADYK